MVAMPFFSRAAKYSRTGLALCGLVLFGLLLTVSAQARVVALVLDDSGSMRPVFEQAAFAIQLLTAVVDRQDQLYLARLNGDGGRVIGPLNLGDRAALLEQIRSAWQAKNKDATHYSPLAATLDTLAQATPPGERASLLIVSDGAFTDPPTEAAMRDHYQQIKGHFRGESLDTYFVVLHHSADLRQIIEQQGIRRQLLTLFNGSPDAGRIDIDNPRNVYPGLRQAITLMHGASHLRNPEIVDFQGSRIDLNPPFSISRLEVIVPGDQQHLPAEFASASFALAQTPPEAFFPQMRGGNARVYHLRPAKTLQPGEHHALNFTGPLPADAQVLFDSGLAVELRFFDAQGRPLQPDAQRRLQVNRNTPIEARATLVDRLAASGEQPVNFAALRRDPVFTLQEGQRSQPMALNRADNYATAKLRYAQPGRYTLTVVASYPGFVTRRAQDLTVEVLSTQDLALSLNAQRRLDCADCAPNEARLHYLQRAQPQDLFAIQALADGAPEAGNYTLTVAEPLPEGVSLRLPTGSALTGASATLNLTPNQPATLELQYDRRYRATAPSHLKLQLRPVNPDWRGEATLDLTLAPQTTPVPLAINARRLAECAQCAADEARLTLLTAPESRELFAIDLLLKDSPGAGDYVVELAAPLPKGVQLLLPNGQPLTDPQATLPLTPGQPATLRLQYNRDYRDSAPYPFKLRLHPASALWRGEASLALNLRPQTGSVELRAAGHTGSDPDAPFVLPVTELEQGQGVYVQALGLLDPLAAGQVSITGDRLRFALTLADGDRVRVQPQKRWGCDCLTPGGEHPFTLNYRNERTGQQAHYQGGVTLERGPWWQVCWQELLALLAALAVIAKLICLWRTERFPSNSRVVITDQDQPGAPRRLPLHRVSATLFTCWSEQRRVEGLVLRATPNGAEILYQRHLSPTLMHLMRGESLVELCQQNPRRTVSWRWGETLEDRELQREYVLVRDIGRWNPAA